MILDAISIKLCCITTIRGQRIEEEPVKDTEKEWMTSKVKSKNRKVWYLGNHMNNALYQGGHDVLFQSVQSLSSVQLFATPWTAVHQASLSITISWSLFKSRPLCRWCHLTISSSVIPFSSHLQSFPASVFSNESVLHVRWPKYQSFNFSISPPKEYSGLWCWRRLLRVPMTVRRSNQSI